ncbi:MAG TPA: sigma-70 family RNA polymerase sigma factor [Ktedonobacterales bacterium]|jgi:RNA polymerase sigma-70 factor (ECF subfamily)
MLQNTISGEIEEWLRTARPRLHRLAQLRGVAPDAIEDVVQETLLEAWKHLDRLHTPEGFHAWLDEICRNICRRYARKEWRDQQRRFAPLALDQNDAGESGETEAAFLMNIPDTHAPDPLEALSRQDMALLLDRALGLLSGSAREVVELCYLLELPQREVAGRLGLSISALEARLHRARQQLRQAVNGPLRQDAEALGLTLDEESAGGWRETRLWCTLCGRRRLAGMFLPQPDGGTNLHMRCPDCERLNGLCDVDNNNVHSKGLVQLEGLHSFRPAWKRTMQTMTRRLTQALLSGKRLCPHCGTPASLQLLDKSQAAGIAGGAALPDGLSRHPYQFWVWWKCPQCSSGPNDDIGVFAASDLVYWSDARTQQFMLDHPHWGSEPELLVEYAGQPAIRFQIADFTSAARLTVLAHRQTLAVLAVFQAERCL